MKHASRRLRPWLISDVSRKMKSLFLFSIVLLAGCAKVVADAPSEYRIASGWLNGDPYELWVRASRVPPLKWNPELEEPPVSSKKAVGLAREGLAKLFPDEHRQFHCSDIRLRQVVGVVGSARGQWCYLIQFTSAALKYVKDGETHLSTIPIVVFFDGSTGLPTKKWANKSLEPTPTAVTPRANE